MKTVKRHLLRELAKAADRAVEEAVAEASGYANAEVMRAALAKRIFSQPEIKGALVELHKKARLAAFTAKPKPRSVSLKAKTGRVQASRLQPRGRER